MLEFFMLPTIFQKFHEEKVPFFFIFNLCYFHLINSGKQQLTINTRIRVENIIIQILVAQTVKLVHIKQNKQTRDIFVLNRVCLFPSSQCLIQATAWTSSCSFLGNVFWKWFALFFTHFLTNPNRNMKHILSQFKYLLQYLLVSATDGSMKEDRAKPQV